MAKIMIVHGWDGSPEEPMLKHLKESLESEGHEVCLPEMPNPQKPEIEAWVNEVGEYIDDIDSETYFIGHSIGCQTIMRYLEKQDREKNVGGIVFIAPWFHLRDLEEGKEAQEIADPWIKTPINTNRIKMLTKKITALFSENDPWVPISDADIFREKLNAKIISESEKGHYTEDDGVLKNSTALTEMLQMIQ